MTALITSNEEADDIKKIIKSFEESSLLIKSVSETIENEAKVQRGRFLGMLVHTLAANLSGSAVAGKGVIQVGEWAVATSWGQGTIGAGEDTIKVGQVF